jgi:uncharacterized membrane protein
MREGHRPRRHISDAPLRALRGPKGHEYREHTVVGRTVTINKPRQEVYAYWRDFSRLPTFMDNVKRVERIDEKRSRWIIAAPGGREIEFISTITEDRPSELIAWESDEDAQVRNSGRVAFRDAPGDRGTVVEATILYDAPGGEIGRLIAKLFQREPNIQIRRDLKRFKQLMETGEIATSVSRPPSGNGRF